MIFNLPFTCLSIKTAIERRTHMQKEFERLRITNYNFWDAYTPESKEVIDFISSGKVKTFPPCFRCGQVKCNCSNNYLMPTQISNALSFMDIFEDIRKNGKDEFYIICEDDISFYKKHLLLLDNLLSKEYLKEKWDYKENKPLLIRLASPAPKQEQIEEIDLNINKVIMSNYCFLINQSFAKYITNNFDRIETTSDIFIHKEISNNILNLTMTPPICHDLSWNEGVFESSIRPKQKHIDYLKNTGDFDGAIKKEKEFKSHVDRIESRELLILGHPRGGTKYIAELIQQINIKIKHEDMGTEGTASWMFAVEDENPYFLPKYSIYAKNRKYNYFYNIIHLIRNPMKSIPSIVVENEYAPDSYNFRRKHILKEYGIDIESYTNKIEKAVISFIYWHRIIEKQNPSIVIRLEKDIKKLLYFLMEKKILLGDKNITELLNIISDIDTNINSEKPYKGKIIPKNKISEIEWNSIDKEIKKLLIEFCEYYLYPIPFNRDMNLVETVPNLYIYQSGKVGSSAIQNSLQHYKDIGLIENLHHVHLLSEENINQRMNELENLGLDRKQEHYNAWKELARTIKLSNPNENLFVIGFRDPIARAVSAIWQNLDIFNKDKKLIDENNRISLKKLQQIFISEYENKHSNLFSWYEYDFKPFMEMDITELNFDNDKGYRITESKYGKILLYKFEDINKTIPIAFEEVLGIKNFELSKTNIGEEKENNYIIAKNNFKLNRELIDNIYNQDFINQFYSSDEINNFKNKWTQENNKKTLYLHIGHHKTGTSAIQQFCVNNRHKLEEQGLLYPETGIAFDRMHHKLAWSLWDKPWAHKDIVEQILEDVESADILWNNLREEIEDRGLNNVLISCEEFSTRSTLEQCQKVKNYINKTFENFEVKIIVYLRRQDEAIESRYKWLVSMPYANITCNIEDYTEEIDSQFHSSLNYHNAISPWASVFGKENIIIKPYIKEGLFEDYFKNFNINIDSENFVFPQSSQSNESIGSIASKIMRATNDNKLNWKDKASFYHSLRTAKLNKKTLLTPVLQKNIFDKYKNSNEKVEKEFLDGKQLFKYPEFKKEYTPSNYTEDLLEGLYLYINKEGEKLSSNLNSINQQIQQKDQQIQQKDNQLQSKEQQLQQRNQQIQQKDQQIQQKDQQIQQKDNQLQSKEQQLQQRNQQIQQKDQQIQQKDQQIQQKDNQLQSKEQQLQQRNQQIQQKDSQIQQKDLIIQSKEEGIRQTKVELESLNNKLQSNNTLIQELNSKVATREDEINNLNDIIEQKNITIKNKNMEINELHNLDLLNNFEKKILHINHKAQVEKQKVLDIQNRINQSDKWYRFGQMSRKRKIWTIGKVLSKKLKIYWPLKPFAKLVKKLLGK